MSTHLWRPDDNAPLIVSPPPTAHAPRPPHEGARTLAARREPLNAWAIVRRHGLLIAACALLAGLGALLIGLRTAPTYAATASIRIDQKPLQLPVIDALGLSQGNELATELEILRSHALAEEVADSLALALIVRSPASVPRSRIFSWIVVARGAAPAHYRLEPDRGGSLALIDRSRGTRLGLLDPGMRMDSAGVAFELASTAGRYGRVDFDIVPFRGAVDDELQPNLDVARRGKEADIVDVTYRGTDALLATDIANTLARRFLARRQDERRAEARGMVRFLGEQIGRVSRQLDASERALRDFREREHVVSLPDEASTGLNQQAELMAQRNELAAERSALDRLLRSARQSRPGVLDSSYRNLLAFPTIMRSGTAATLLAPLAAAEDQRNALLGRRTLQDPDVQLATARIGQIHGEIESLVGTYLQGLTNQVRALDTILASSSASLRSIPRREIRLAELERAAKSDESIYSLLQGRLQEAQIAQAATDASVRLVDPAVVPRKPVAPRPLLNLSLALIAGALVGFAGASAREISDRSLHTRRELVAASGVPVMGIVPRALRRPGLRQLVRRDDDPGPRVAMSEAFAWLATNLVVLRPAAPVKALVVTSALPGDGKTTVAINLGKALARHGRRVLVLDADLRRGRLGSALGIPQGPGLSEVLAGSAKREHVVRRIALGEGAELFVIPAGSPTQPPAKLLASDHMHALLKWARVHYDVTIADSPPMNVTADAALVAPHSDGVLIVARAGVTARDAIGLAVEQLTMLNAPIVGTVLNAVDLRRDGAYDRAYRYYAHEPSDGAQE